MRDLKVFVAAVAVLSLLSVPGMLGTGCGGSAQPGGVLNVAELLANPVYDSELEVYGELGLLGQLNCPCFELSSGGEGVQVWYDLMVEDDGTQRPAVSVEDLHNGDRVVVTGELKTAGKYRHRGDFWAVRIELAG